jgi:hypothetical protein
MAHSSSGLGRVPLKDEITGSNPVCATNLFSQSQLGSFHILSYYVHFSPVILTLCSDICSGFPPIIL